MPGIKISEVDRKKIDPKFICCSCNLLLLEPMQTPCGHLICLSCLQTVLGSSNPTCPEDGTELKKDQVFLDAFTKRELRKICLACPNKPCTWSGPYDSLEGHSGVCEHALINCVHSQCKKPFQRSHLREHLENECEYRNVKCEHCEAELSFASVKEHVETSCPSALVKCKYCKQKIMRKDIKQHEELTCDEFPGTCEFQAIGCNDQKVLKRKELRQHFNDGLIYHVQLLLHFVFNFFSQLKDCIPRVEFQSVMNTIREEVSEVRVAMSNFTEKIAGFVGRITGLERRVESLESTGGVDTRVKNEVQELKNKVAELNEELASLRQGNANLERENRAKTSAIERLRGRFDQVNESLALNTVKITDLESVRGPAQPIHSFNGTLLWKIDAFARKRGDAVNGVKSALYSPHFYSSQFGYKMCAKIYMNGNGFGKGSHLSLFFVVMKGEYDALQTWPFQKQITMMLLDQGNGDHMIEAFHSDPQSSSFQRPRSDMNIPSGSPLFMPLDSLNNRQYIKDDVIFFKITVTDNSVANFGQATCAFGYQDDEQ